MVGQCPISSGLQYQQWIKELDSSAIQKEATQGVTPRIQSADGDVVQASS